MSGPPCRVWGGAGHPKDDYQLGNNKVFMRNPVENILEDHRQKKIVKFVIILQKHFRRALARIHYMRARRAILLAQRCTSPCAPRMLSPHRCLLTRVLVARSSS